MMQKKHNFKALALAGLTAGLIVSGQLSAVEKDVDSPNPATNLDPNLGNMGYHLMTEEELLLELSSEGAAMYKSLPPEGKKMALEVASMRCNGTNLCAGLNACQTSTNSCAGKGSCKGKGKCAIADKNLAVKLVRDKLAKKRAEASSHRR